MRFLWKVLLFFVISGLTVNSCRLENIQEGIVCTTGMIGDIARNLIGNHVRVEVLMGPGVDPHLYKATQGDIEKLVEAEVILYNGLHLEGKMGEIFEKLQNQKTVYPVAGEIPPGRLINLTGFRNAHDPHIWFDVSLWMDAVRGTSKVLQEKYPQFAGNIHANETAYLHELRKLDHFCRQEIASIPPSQRVMITAHDAFKYFGKAYNIEVRGLQGISTTAEYGLRDVSSLVNFIAQNKIKAIFVESSVPKRSVEAVIEGCRQKGHQLQLGGELFSDAMGTAGSPEGTYIGMVKHNVHTIVNALK